MIQEEINVYVDGFLSLIQPFELKESLKELRAQLIEEACEAPDIEDLLRDWLILHGLNAHDAAWKIMLWFGFNYQQVGRIFHMDVKEVSQLLRAQRGLLLPTYPPVTKAMESVEIEGVSCFMVEQQMSLYLDSELVDSRTVRSIRQHIKKCSDCENRLNEYRQLNRKVLLSRKVWPSISNIEWNDAMAASRSRRRAFWRTAILYLIVVLVVAIALIIFFQSRPEEMPNIYDITS